MEEEKAEEERNLVAVYEERRRRRRGGRVGNSRESGKKLGSGRWRKMSKREGNGVEKAEEGAKVD